VAGRPNETPRRPGNRRQPFFVLSDVRISPRRTPQETAGAAREKKREVYTTTADAPFAEYIRVRRGTVQVEQPEQ